MYANRVHPFDIWNNDNCVVENTFFGFVQEKMANTIKRISILYYFQHRQSLKVKRILTNKQKRKKDIHFIILCYKKLFCLVV